MVERRPVEEPRGEPRASDRRRPAGDRLSSNRLRRASRILDRRSRVHPHVVLPYRADAPAHVVVRVCRPGPRRCREPERAGGCRAGGTAEDRGCATCERDAISRACNEDDTPSRPDRGTVGGRERCRRHARHCRTGSARRRRHRRRSETPRDRRAANSNRVSVRPTRSRRRKPVFAGSLADSQEKYWRSASLAADRGICLVGGAAAARQRLTAWRARIPLQRSREFR